jgi:hypothetical protein
MFFYIHFSLQNLHGLVIARTKDVAICLWVTLTYKQIAALVPCSQWRIYYAFLYLEFGGIGIDVFGNIVDHLKTPLKSPRGDTTYREIEDWGLKTEDGGLKTEDWRLNTYRKLRFYTLILV